jgi:hypothetical protein
MTVKNARTETHRAGAIASVAIRVLLAAGATAMWFTSEVRVFALVALPTAVAALLVVYVDWREKLRRRMLADGKEYRAPA